MLLEGLEGSRREKVTLAIRILWKNESRKEEKEGGKEERKEGNGKEA